MQRHLIRLDFQSPLHIGSDEPLIGIEGVQPGIHSDTIFSGMINVWARLIPRRISGNMPDVGEVLKRFTDGYSPFKISSCFPYQGYNYYLPRPMTFPKELLDPNNRWKYGKSVKERRFIYCATFCKWCAGENVLGDFADDEPRKPYKQAIVPRVTVDRPTSRPQLFHCGVVYFDENCGLYFLLEVENDEWLGYIEAVLRLLGEYGVGGERTTGCGRFRHELVRDIEVESEWKDIFSGSSNANAYCVLSLYYPRASERDMFHESQLNLAYEIVPRRGWVFSSVVGGGGKRQSCNMLAEGSVVPRAPIGKLARVTPSGFTEHEVYRYGYAMSVPITVPDAIESGCSHE